MSPQPVNVRMDYGDRSMDVADLDEDPIVQLQRWLDDAARTDQLVEPSAMALSTVDADGHPSTRTVLLRRIAEGRLLFFTNYGSRKATEIDAHPSVSLLFRWANPQRQVEIRGRAVRATAAESDEYFASRPRASQIGAHTSPQSRPLSGRDELDAMVERITASFDGVDVIPRPDSWGGYAVTPRSMEFWQGRSSRLHDRIRYDRTTEGTWRAVRLAP
jgi:pyridoxamine 5'-phosphate oxidase